MNKRGNNGDVVQKNVDVFVGLCCVVLCVVCVEVYKFQFLS